MLSYFAAWILEAGNCPVLLRAVRPSTLLGKAGGGRSRQLRDGAELARHLQPVQENAKDLCAGQRLRFCATNKGARSGTGRRI
jgi:hypothetical protein